MPAPATADQRMQFFDPVSCGAAFLEAASPRHKLKAGQPNPKVQQADKGAYTVSLTATDSLGTSSPTVMKGINVAAVALQNDPVLAGKKALVVGGTTASDRIEFIKVGSKVRVLISKVSQGIFSPTGRIIAYGKAGNDTILVASTITLPAWLFGGAGNDVMTAGGGPAILVGDAGKDKLTGHGMGHRDWSTCACDRTRDGGGRASEECVSDHTVVAAIHQSRLPLGSAHSKHGLRRLGHVMLGSPAPQRGVRRFAPHQSHWGFPSGFPLRGRPCGKSQFACAFPTALAVGRCFGSPSASGRLAYSAPRKTLPTQPTRGCLFRPLWLPGNATATPGSASLRPVMSIASPGRPAL